MTNEEKKGGNRQLRARRALSLYQVYGDSALLVLIGTVLNSSVESQKGAIAIDFVQR